MTVRFLANRSLHGHSHQTFDRLRRLFSGGLDFVEYLGLIVIGIASSVAMYHEVTVMIAASRAQLADLLLMFLYIEVLAMIGQHFKSGQLPARFPMYIAMWRLLAVASAIFLLTLGVLLIRYGHVRFPYRKDAGYRATESPSPKSRGAS